MDWSEKPISKIVMKNLNPIKKKLSKDYKRISVKDSSKLLAEFFNGVVIELDEEYSYDS